MSWKKQNKGSSSWMVPCARWLQIISSETCCGVQEGKARMSCFPSQTVKRVAGISGSRKEAAVCVCRAPDEAWREPWGIAGSQGRRRHSRRGLFEPVFHLEVTKFKIPCHFRPKASMARLRTSSSGWPTQSDTCWHLSLWEVFQKQPRSSWMPTWWVQCLLLPSPGGQPLVDEPCWCIHNNGRTG